MSNLAKYLLGAEPLADLEYEFDHSLPVSREIEIRRFHRQLAQMQEILIEFHTQLEFPKQSAHMHEQRGQVIYARIWLQSAVEGIQGAIGSLEALDKNLRDWETTLTELTEFSQNDNK